MLRRLPLMAVLLTLAGCLTVPHMNQRSPEVSGRVIDIYTARPIADARVEFIDNPALAALTDEKGEFRIAATNKPELFVPLGTGPHAMDLFARIVPLLRVTKDGYAPVELDAYEPPYLDLNAYTARPLPGPQNDLAILLRPIGLMPKPR